jgi:hypothetical protein
MKNSLQRESYREERVTCPREIDSLREGKDRICYAFNKYFAALEENKIQEKTKVICLIATR